MSPEQRERFLDHANEVLAAEAEQSAMSEGRPHKHAKNRALDRLGQFLRRSGRRIYLADELAVHYPGERPFAPDLLAILDVEDPGEDDPRTAWVVVDEGKGLDWVLEIHYRGDRGKDFVENVARYARLGIQEYFIYDRTRQALTAYHLPERGARVYQPIKARFGKFASQVLGIDLAVTGGTLRFFTGDSELPGTEDLLVQLGRMVEELQERNESAEARAEQEQARAEQERARAEAAEARALEQQRQAIRAVLTARSLDMSEPVRAAIDACTDPDTLARWLTRAITAASGSAVVQDVGDPDRG